MSSPLSPSTAESQGPPPAEPEPPGSPFKLLLWFALPLLAVILWEALAAG